MNTARVTNPHVHLKSADSIKYNGTNWEGGSWKIWRLRIFTGKLEIARGLEISTRQHL